jgi:transcriptional regulator with XRE-family HTH domain
MQELYYMTASAKPLVKRTEKDQQLLQQFGENLKKLRESKSISQEHFAYEAGFSRSYYTEVENGKRNISLLNIVKIASLLDIELNELLPIKNRKPQNGKK